MKSFFITTAIDYTNAAPHIGHAAFLWSLNSGQFEDLDGASWRALQDDEHGKPKSR